MPLFDSLYNFARWQSHDSAEAEDLVQETFAKALRGFASYTPGTNFRAWMFRILRNTFLTSRTGLAARMTVPLEDEEGPIVTEVEQDTPESLLLANAAHEDVQQAIDALPVHYREVLLLCDVEEMRYQEISETLDIPVGTVMSRLNRARKAVRGTLTERKGNASIHAGTRKNP